MFLNQIKTTVLLVSMSGLLLMAGKMFGGQQGLIFAFFISIAMNFFAYFFSEKMVLAMYKAQPLSRSEFAWVHTTVEELCAKSNMPMPKLWYIDTDAPNAFATGRNPSHASVAVTRGILDILEPHELRGVLAHEISHIKNRDILIGTIAATIATTIGYLADMLQWSLWWGGRDDRDRGNTFGLILTIIFMPMAAMLIQFAISRSREYLADETGARCCNDPLSLASALEKLKFGNKIAQHGPVSHAEMATASLFIVYPFSGKSLFNWFSTHPPLEKRIEILRRMARNGR